MVPLVVLLAIVPLAMCAGHDGDMMQNQMMQQMMQQMMMQQMNKGWGNNYNMGHHDDDDGNSMMNGAANGNWMNMQSAEDYDAYLKWCEEKRMAAQEQEQQKKLMMMWEQKEKERKENMEKKRKEHEAEERQEMMMSQWKMWERRVHEQQEFESLNYKLMEMKHEYSFSLTSEFLKFCKCSDFIEDLEKFFIHDGVTMGGQEFNLDDLETIDSNDALAVAQALANRPKADQIKAFFGGLAGAMCEGAKNYVGQLTAWEREYKFMERLL